MPLSPVIATSLADSQIFDPLAEPAHYKVQIFDATATFTVGDLVADLANPKNLGYSDYANAVPEMFVTLHQDDPQWAVISALLDSDEVIHYRIWRGNRIVHTGWIMESDEEADDVVLYGYGYLAGLFWYLTDWDQTFESISVANIVRTLWTTNVKAAANTMFAHVATGSIEGAQDSTEGSGEIILPDYPVYHKRVLHAFQELAALGLSDTSLNVLMEVTHSENPAFNFWHNRGQRKAGLRMTYGDGGQIQSFRRRRNPVFRRNDIRVIGSTPFTTILRKSASDSTDITAHGRRQEPLFLSWVRDETELERIAKLRLKHALRQDFDLSVRLKPNSWLPPGAYGSQVNITDSFPVQIKRGGTDLEQYMLLAGYQMIVNGDEFPNLMLQEDRQV